MGIIILDMIEKKRITGIVPLTTSLPDGRSVEIKLMTDEQLSRTFAMIQEAAQDGDGFGVDEFTSELDFREEIKGSYPFAIVDTQTGNMVAAAILAISKYYRGNQVADPFIIVSKSERRRGIGDFCLQLCVELAPHLGFVGMYVDTFSNNYAMIRIIEGVGGFQKVGCLPMGGRLKSGDIVGTVIYYKDLRAA